MAQRIARQDLSRAEWEIMKTLWAHGDMALGEIVSKLPPGPNWAYSTVKTFVRRMAAKGWVSSRRVGSSHLYSAAVKKGSAVGSAVRDFTRRVLDGVLTPFVAYYVEDKGLSDDEIAELERIIKDCRQRKGGRK